MFKFFKNSFREIKHVVWPTRKETSNYLTIVLTVLILFWTYLFLASTLFSEVLLYLKNLMS
jgi:preprotein translocase SecE subunit